MPAAAFGADLVGWRIPALYTRGTTTTVLACNASIQQASPATVTCSIRIAEREYNLVQLQSSVCYQ